ncbi:aminotransferase-like domain-containing protein [Bifidobacterium vespertilionis]|uniref:PLP-dependent aminotransferase family protein n=1 Tax=Bifidobacterium vespertilionis TaxID=2562524 RepID=A0A5J5E0Z7_9BIFI|nr:PLP-dependent aminotransferase family protein [Bifidobacterium vespertilionis]KAA8818377.1 PLP-dependent aminotransferase family protein [Bifidobacterium vespertilionis]KAA8822857.1 PLP-dependent aminotransferase family protein [Bifidobacterium vespertilionis]
MARPAPIAIDWKPDRDSATPITEQIVQYMCRQVSSGAWPIGARLPAQRAMADAFGVNRSTIIAAVNELADYGIVEGLHGAGTRIVSNTWSLMLPGSPDWADYVSSGFFKANNDTIQAINRLEFDPSMARLGTGELDPRLFPRSMWRTVLTRAANEITSMGYPEPEGTPELREAIAAHMRKLGVETEPGQILVTSGALQALQIISVSLLSAGSTVFCEAPSYIKSLQVFQSAGMRLEGVRMDGHGIDVDALRDAMQGMIAGGLPAPGAQKPSHKREGESVLYTIPTNHNPTGIIMDAQRRRELIACCVERRLPIIEDGAYQDLVFDGPSPAPLKSLDETGMVIYLGSASKALAPGLRIGWIVAPEPIVHRLADVKMQMDYGASRLSQWVFARFLDTGLYDRFLTDLRGELRRRRDAALETLDRLFGGIAHWNTPAGGFYIWLTFNGPMPMARLFAKAVEAGVLLNPGDIYDFEGDNSLRLSYAYTTPDEFAAAAERLAGVVRTLG